MASRLPNNRGGGGLSLISCVSIEIVQLTLLGIQASRPDHLAACSPLKLGPTGLSLSAGQIVHMARSCQLWFRHSRQLVSQALVDTARDPETKQHSFRSAKTSLSLDLHGKTVLCFSSVCSDFSSCSICSHFHYTVPFEDYISHDALQHRKCPSMILLLAMTLLPFDWWG